MYGDRGIGRHGKSVWMGTWKCLVYIPIPEWVGIQGCVCGGTSYGQTYDPNIACGRNGRFQNI